MYIVSTGWVRKLWEFLLSYLKPNKFRHTNASDGTVIVLEEYHSINLGDKMEFFVLNPIQVKSRVSTILVFVPTTTILIIPISNAWSLRMKLKFPLNAMESFLSFQFGILQRIKFLYLDNCFYHIHNMIGIQSSCTEQSPGSMNSLPYPWN